MVLQPVADRNKSYLEGTETPLGGYGQNYGIGYLPAADCPPNGINAASHCDGISYNTSVWLDGVQVTDCGKVVHPDLVDMARRLFPE